MKTLVANIGGIVKFLVIIAKLITTYLTEKVFLNDITNGKIFADVSTNKMDNDSNSEIFSIKRQIESVKVFNNQ